MHQRTSIERILAIEKAMDVTTIRYKGLRLWPLVRMQLWRRLMHPNKFAPPATIGLKHLADKLSQSFFKPDFYVSFLEHSKRHQHNLTKLAKGGPVDLLLFSKGEDHVDKLRGKYFNRYLDPIADLARTRFTTLKVEVITEATNQSLPRYEYTHFLDAEEFIRCDAQRSLINAFQKNGDGAELEKGDQLTRLLGSIRFDLALPKEYLMVEAERMLHYIRYFQGILSVLKPKAVFLAGYGEEFSMALIAACKRLGIITVDVQQQAIGAYHGMYTHWMSMPDTGYKLLPDYFWCWSSSDVQNIQDGKSTSPGFHRPVIGGNLWVSKWFDDESKMPGKNAESYLNKLDPDQKRILVSLSNSEDCLGDNLIEAIRQSPPDWHWWVRVYPGKEQKIEEIASLFADLNISNVEVSIPSKIPVYRLLKYVTWHVSEWSTVAIEALQFGVPSVITHPAGRELYYQHIMDGYFAYKEHPAAIIEQIEKNPVVENKVEKYLVTSRIYALDALFDVTESASQMAEA